MSDRKNEIFGGDRPIAGVPQAHRRDVLKEDFNYEVPVEAVPLPSEGKVYSVNSPIHGAETVDIKAMTAKEEDILTSRAFIKKGIVISELLKSCIMTPGIVVDELLAGDRNALMIAVRITGYGREYKAEIQCSACNEKVEASFDLAALPIKRLTISPSTPGENQFEFMLPVSKKKVIFKFLTGNDENDLLSENEKRRKTLGIHSDSLITSKLQRSIISIDGNTDRSKINIFVKNMPARDSHTLRKYMEQHEPGIEMKGHTVCPACDAEQEVQMPLGVSFFWPSL